jgi:phosphate:Na+ symporter
MALVNLFFNLGMATLLSLMMPTMLKLLDRWWPPLSTEDLATVEHLHPQSLADPETALDLAEKEQARLIGRLPTYLTALRPTPGQKTKVDVQDMHRAFGLLWSEVDSFLTTLLHMPLTNKTAARVTNVHNRNGVIRLLEETLHHLVTSVSSSPRSPRLDDLVDNFVEALDFILLTAGDAAANREPDDARLLAGLCADRGEMMGKIRALYLSGELELGPKDKSLLLDLTTQFDRIVWMLGRYAGLIEQERQADSE